MVTSGWPIFAVLAALKRFMGVANGEDFPELRSQRLQDTAHICHTYVIYIYVLNMYVCI